MDSLHFKNLSWIGSLDPISQATSNFPRLPTLNQTLWNLYEKNSIDDWNSIKTYPNVYSVVKEKKKAGFPVSLVESVSIRPLPPAGKLRRRAEPNHLPTP